MRSLEIDLVSDVVCPWCLIGTRHLDLALGGLPDVAATIRFRPFLLDPSTPSEGVDLRQRLREKYAADPEAMFGRVEAAAHAAGISLDFSKIRRSVNTVRAHTLLRYALQKEPATQGPLARALFGAYFLEGLDIGRIDVLAALAADHGLNGGDARILLADPDALAQTRAEAAELSRQGISGVPFFILAGRLAVSGAQPPATLRAAIERALALD
jgi:predicted DsbA family dithiol-disulfide isomerase